MNYKTMDKQKILQPSLQKKKYTLKILNSSPTLDLYIQCKIFNTFSAHLELLDQLLPMKLHLFDPQIQEAKIPIGNQQYF